MTRTPSAPEQPPAVIAHRGASSVAPQNTLAAFEAAWRSGAGAIELDVQLTADGQVVVIHDDTLDATTDGTGEVARTTLAAVRALDAGSWFSPAYAGQRVPTFAEVVDLLARRPGIGLLLEVKGDWTVDQARRVTGPLRAAGLSDRVVAQSFWPGTVEALAEADPDLRRGLLVTGGTAGLLGEWLDERPGRPADRTAAATDGPVGARGATGRAADLATVCQRLGVVTCNPDGALLAEDPGLVERLHDAGLMVAVWTLDEPEHWAQAVHLGVDGIITDRPDRLLGWLTPRTAPLTL